MRHALELSGHYLAKSRSFFARAADYWTYGRWGTGRVTETFAARAIGKAHPPVAAATQADALNLLRLAIQVVPIAELGRYGFADSEYVLQMISTLRLAISRREHIAGFYLAIVKDPNIHSASWRPSAAKPDWSRGAERVVDCAARHTPFKDLPAVLDLDLDQVKDLLQDVQALWMDHRRSGPSQDR